MSNVWRILARECGGTAPMAPCPLTPPLCLCYAPKTSAYSLLTCHSPSGAFPMRDFRLLTLVSAFVFVAMGFTSPVMTIYLESLGASFAQISLILTSFTLAALLANYTSGRLSDRLTRRKPLLIGGLLLLGFAYFWLSTRADRHPGLARPHRRRHRQRHLRHAQPRHDGRFAGTLGPAWTQHGCFPRHRFSFVCSRRRRRRLVSPPASLPRLCS